MSLHPISFEEALKAHKPMKRSRMSNSAPTASPARRDRKPATATDKPVPARRGLITRKPMTRGKKVATKPKRKKKLTDGQLKKRVWKEFSIFIRTRGADSEGMNECITCNSGKVHWKLLQAGHFVRGRLNANLFDERGCNPQCYICNIHRQGNVIKYYKWMLVVYGQAVIDELEAQNNATKKWQGGELQGMLDHYKNLNKENGYV